MKTLWLKIAGSVVLVLAAIIVVRAFWSAETEPVTEPKSTKQTEQIQEKNAGNFAWWDQYWYWDIFVHDCFGY